MDQPQLSAFAFPGHIFDMVEEKPAGPIAKNFGDIQIAVKKRCQEGGPIAADDGGDVTLSYSSQDNTGS
jgi:hypothetical protein